MESRTWWCAVIAVALYTLLPAIWMYTQVGVSLPATTVTMGSVWLAACICTILVAMGYAIGRNKPEPNPLRIPFRRTLKNVKNP